MYDYHDEVHELPNHMHSKSGMYLLFLKFSILSVGF